MVSASSDSVRNIHSRSNRCCNTFVSLCFYWAYVVLTSYSIARSCPKKIFLNTIPKQMALNSAKFAKTCESGD